jgi:hypothetical protein
MIMPPKKYISVANKNVLLTKTKSRREDQLAKNICSTFIAQGRELATDLQAQFVEWVERIRDMRDVSQAAGREELVPIIMPLLCWLDPSMLKGMIPGRCLVVAS